MAWRADERQELSLGIVPRLLFVRNAPGGQEQQTAHAFLAFFLILSAPDWSNQTETRHLNVAMH